MKPLFLLTQKAAAAATTAAAEDESEKILNPPGTMCAKADPKDPLDGSFVYNTPTGKVSGQILAIIESDKYF